MTYSLDFRKPVLEVTERDPIRFEDVSERVRLGTAHVFSGSKPLEAKPTRDQPATQIDLEKFKTEVETYPDASQYERAQRLGVSRKGMGSALKRLGMSRKKNVFAFQSRGSRANPLERENRNVSKNPSTTSCS